MWFVFKVKICVKRLCHPLSEEQFLPVIAQNYYESKHFYFELDHDQTKQLVSLFTSSPMKFDISTKWNKLYASLPAPPKRQENYAPLSPRMPRQTLHENLNKTSKVSYASALVKPATTTASSSQYAGRWSALLSSELGDETNDDDEWEKESQPVETSKSEVRCGNTSEDCVSPHSNTVRDEWPLNQEYEEKNDFVQADHWESWEESDWFANDVVQENTWDERQHTATNTCEVEVGQTAGSNGQHPDYPLSPRRLDDKPVLNSSLCVETTESGNEENDEHDNSLISNTDIETSTNLQPLVVKVR